jgi:DNA polymerase-3 subunit beta
MLFNRKQILEILISHQNNVDKRAINPIFSSVRFYSNGKDFFISSMDGERQLHHATESAYPEFDIFLPCTNLYELLKKSNSETFELIESDSNYTIKIGNGEFIFAKYAQKGYPEWQDSYEHEVVLNSEILANALKLVKWASSNDDSRPFLNGVCLDFQEEINICSTDGLRLALQKLPNKTGITGTWIFSKKSVNDLVKLLEDASGDLHLFLGKNAQIKFSTGSKLHSQITWSTLLVAGKFPQYSKIIPTTSISKLHIEGKEFVETIERMMIMANINQPVVTLNLGSKSTIFSENALSSGKDNLGGVYTGEELKISFNGRLLLEILNNLSGSLNFEINNPYAPVLITGEKYKDAIFILAPVKKD